MFFISFIPFILQKLLNLAKFLSIKKFYYKTNIKQLFIFKNLIKYYTVTKKNIL